jgi:integrase
LLAVVGRCLRWGKRTINLETGKKYLASDPSADLQPPMSKGSSERDRVLSDDEIRAFWCGCDAIGWPFGPLLQLCLLLGQRSHKETAGMEWDEIDDKKDMLWHLPGSRTKNSKPNDLHLSDLALKVIRSMKAQRQPPLPGKPWFVFSTTRCGPVTGFDSAVKRLRAMMPSDGVEVPWRVHDLRRTCSTNMGRLDIDQRAFCKPSAKATKLSPPSTTWPCSQPENARRK